MTSTPIIINTGCENAASEIKTCSPELENKSAKNACDEVVNKYKEWSKLIQNWSPVGIIEAIGSNNKSDVRVQNLIKNVQTSINQSDLQNKCSNTNISNQLNIIEDTPECLQYKLQMMESLKNTPELLKDFLDSWNITNVTQDNISSNIKQCILSTHMEALNKQEASIENSALSLLMQKSSGLLSKNDAEQNQCQFVDNTMSACNYLKSTSCCNNKNITTQTNILRCKGGKDITQKNNMDNFQYCNLTGTSKLSLDQIGKLTNKSSIDTKQISEGINPMSLFLFILLPFIIFGGGVGLTAKYFKDLMPFMGLIPIIIGSVFTIIFATSEKPTINRTVENRPLSGSKCSYNYYTGDILTSYKQAYDKCEKDLECVGADFIYVENSEGGPESVDTEITEGKPFNIKGSAIYYKNINSVCDEEPEDDGKKYFTFYKNSKNNMFLIAGVSLIILCILYSIAYKFLSKK